MKNKKINILGIVNILSLILFILLIILLKFVDVGYAPNLSKIGLKSFNYLFLVKPVEWVNIIAEGMFILSIIGFVLPWIILFLQFLKTKSLKQLDKRYVLYCILTIVVAVIYIVFDKAIVINQRPYLYEASFPSTHVMIFTFVTIAGFRLFFNNKSQQFKLNGYIIIAILIVLMMTFRVLVAEHWITDVIGGLLIGLFVATLEYNIYSK